MAGGGVGSVSLREYCVCWYNGAVFAPSRTDECSLSCCVKASLELMLDSEADVSETGYSSPGLFPWIWSSSGPELSGGGIGSVCWASLLSYGKARCGLNDVSIWPATSLGCTSSQVVYGVLDLSLWVGEILRLWLFTVSFMSFQRRECRGLDSWGDIGVASFGWISLGTVLKRFDPWRSISYGVGIEKISVKLAFCFRKVFMQRLLLLEFYLIERVCVTG